jgi:hypothetical protein
MLTIRSYLTCHLSVVLTAGTVGVAVAGAADPSVVPTAPESHLPAAMDAPAVAHRPLTTLEANGFRVSLDTLGFRQELGTERFRGNYFRIALFTATLEGARESGGGFTFSLLVDDLPKGVKDLKSLFTHCVVSNKLTARLKDGSLQPIRSPRSASGLLYRYPQRLPAPASFPKGSPSEFTQWHWYFESIQNGKWFEIHFSRGVALNAPVPEEIEPVIDRILRSLQFPGASPEE